MLATHSSALTCISARPLWRSLLLTIIILVLPSFFPLNLAAETPLPNLDRPNTEAFEQQYKAANDYFLQLEHGSALGKDRSNWLNGARNFRKIHLAQKKGLLGPSSLYMMAKMQRRMFDLFKVPIDLENALDQFLELAALYPGHSLADDALYAAAESALLIKGKEQQAAGLYQKIVDVYPKSDHYDKALARIQEQKEKRPGPLAEALPSPSTTKNLVHVFPVKYWSSTDYTRIVIQTSASVSYSANVLEKNGEQPRKLTIDLPQSFISPNFCNPVLLQDGLLKQIRPSQFSNDTVRISLDIESLSEYKVFSLSDPFRVIVDVHGSTPGSTEQTAKKPGLSQSIEPQDKELSAVLQASTEKPVINLEDQKKRSARPETQKKTMRQDKISLAQQLGLGIRKIVIDPGHGGKDPGAMAFNLKEKDIVLNVAKKIAKILKSTYRYEVALTRTKDVYVPLEERTAIANTQNSDLFISIHVNANADKTIGGIETYFLNLATNADAMRVAALENATSTHKISDLQDILSNLMKNSKIDESSRLAQFVHANLVSGVEQKYKMRDLGVKQAPFYVLIGAEMPAILAEISFITNPTEARLLQDEHYLQKIAEHIAAGIAAYVDHHHTAAVKF